MRREIWAVGSESIVRVTRRRGGKGGRPEEADGGGVGDAAVVLQMHRDVPRAARFYAEGLDFSVNVCTLRWAELQSEPLKLALMHTDDSNLASQRVYSSMLSFTVPDINSTVTKLLSLGAELDGPIKHEITGKVAAVRCIDGHMLGLYESA